jgi:TolA-binding protein
LKAPLSALLFFSFAWCLQPDTFEEFENNTLRLLGGRQYTYLAEYWASWAGKWVRHARISELALATSARLPRLEQRQKALKAICDAEGEYAPRSRVYLEYGMGLILSGDFDAAAAALSKSREREALFHKGEALIASGDADRARVAFDSYLDRGGAAGANAARARLRQAELALGAGRLGDAKKWLAAAGGDTPDALILACRLAERGAKKEEYARALAELKRRFPGHEKTEAYLAQQAGGKRGG